MVTRVIGLWLCLIAAHATVAEEDWEKAAARAATTEKGLYETSGARDPATLPPPRAPTPPAEVARQPVPLSANEQKIQKLRQDILRGRREHAEQIRNLDRRYQMQYKQLQAAKKRKADAEAALKKLNASKAWYQKIIDDAETDRLQLEASAAEMAIKTHTTQATRWRNARDKRIGDARRYEEALQLQITRLDTARLAKETATRTRQAADAKREFETQRAQIEVGELEFAIATQQLKVKIANAEAADKDEEAELAEAELEKLEQTHSQWRKGQDVELANHRKELTRLYEANREDGIGPRNSGDLNSHLRKEARAKGEDPGSATQFVDTTAVQAAKGSATTIAAAAGKNTTHENTAVTFLRDYYVDNAVTLFTDPGEFIVRYLYYAKGVGRAAKDAIVDLAVLGYEIGDTGAEAIEVAINTYTGTNTNITGKENVTALGNIGNKAAILLDFDDPEGARIAQEAMAKGESVIDALDRRYEKMAGQGKVGIRKALEDTGYVTGTVLAPEEALARAAAAALLTKVKGLDDLGKLAGSAPDAPTPSGTGAAGDAARAPDANLSANADAGNTGATSRAPDVDTGSGAGTTGKPETSTGRTPVAKKADTPPVDVRRDADGNIVVRDAGGNELTLGEEIGRGSSTGVFKVKGRDDIVVRLSRSTPGGEKLDEFGRRAILEADPSGTLLSTPATLGSQRINTGMLPQSKHGDIIDLEGGTLTIVEKAPDTFNKPGVTRSASGGMTKGQIEAYRNAMDALNKKGYVFLDNHHGNYSFRKVEGTADEWTLVIPDRESIAPAKSPEAAAKVQQALDTPQSMTGFTPKKENWNLGDGSGPGREFTHEALAELDPLMDWQRWQTEAGHNYRSLGKDGTQGEGVFPFDPRNAVDYPEAAKPLDYQPTKAPGQGPPLKAPDANLDVAALGGSKTATPGADAAPASTADSTPTRSGDDSTPTRTAADKGDRPRSGADAIDPERRAIAIRESNVVPEHAEAFSKVARESGEIIMMRPVNPHATERIVSGAATKGMNIKGKSADWGPQRGMIPVDPIYSKMGTPEGGLATGVTPEKIKSYRELNNKALGKPYEELVDGKWVKRKPKKPIAQEIEVDGPNGEKIKVLADFSDPPRPITADYDLFAVSSKRGEGGLVDDPEQVAEMGSIGRNEVATMNRLNDAAKQAGYTGGNVVHHGPANRFAGEFEAADFPITVFLPNGDVQLLHSSNEVRRFFESWSEKGFRMDHMPGWDFGELTQAERAARDARGQLKRAQREATERQAVEDLKQTNPNTRTAVAAGKAIQAEGEKREREKTPEPLRAPEAKPDTRSSTGEPEVASAPGTTAASPGSSAATATGAASSDDNTQYVVGGGTGAEVSPISPIYFSFYSGGFYDDRSYVQPPPAGENRVSLGGGVTFELESAVSVSGTNVHSSRDLIALGTQQTAEPAPPPPRAEKPKPKPKPPAAPAPAPTPPPADDPILVTPPGGTPMPPPAQEPAPAPTPTPPPPKAPGKLALSGDTRISEVHTVGGSPCPQTLGTFAIANIGDSALEYRVSNGGSFLALSGDGGTLAPGARSEVNVQFTCSGFGAMPGAGSAKTVNAGIDIDAGGAGSANVAVSLSIASP